MHCSMNVLIKRSFGRAFSVAFLCIITATAYALEDKKYSNWNDSIKRTIEACNSVAGLRIPKEDRPDAKTAKKLKQCDSMGYYYGQKKSVDYKKARHCAITKNYYNGLDNSVTDSTAVLMMIYANGKGVEQNLDLAIHYACKFRIITAAHVRRIEHLIQMKEGKRFQKNFEYGDDAYHVANLVSDILSFIQQSRLHNSQLIGEVQQRANSYILSRVHHELDYDELPIHSYQEDIRIRNEWFHLLQQIADCKGQKYDQEAYRKADAELNKVYQLVRNNVRLKKNNKNRGTFADILETERLWIKYKEAIVELGHEICPKITPYTWSTLLTLQRISQLQALVVMQ